MNQNDLSTQLLFSTLPIWTTDAQGNSSSATAFIYNVPVPGHDDRSLPFLVTNHHVLANARRALVEMVFEQDGGPSLRPEGRVRVEIDPTVLLRHADPTSDLAVIPLGPTLNAMTQSGRPAYFRSVGPELIPDKEAMSKLSALEDIIFIGYPSGIRDERNGTPLIRRGITATPVWNDYDGKPTFLIDAGVFPGSSGSPVFILNQGAYSTGSGITIGSRILFLGIVAGSYTRSEASGSAYLGLGTVVRSDRLKTFIDGVAEPMIVPGIP